MPKKKKKKKSSSNKVKIVNGLNDMIDFDYKLIESPFGGLSPDKTKEIIKSLGQGEKKKYEASLKELKDYIKPFDVSNMVCWFSMYRLTTVAQHVLKSRHETGLIQFHVELLQAIALQNVNDGNTKWKPVLPDDARKIEELLIKVARSFIMKRIADIDFEDETERRRLAILEDVRGNTLAVRNWGNPEQILRIVRGLFGPIDNNIEIHTGVSILNLIRMWENMHHAMEDKLNEHIGKVRKMLRHDDTTDMIDYFLEYWPQINTTKEKMLETCKLFNSKDEVAKYLICLSDLFIQDIFMFRLEDFIGFYTDKVDPRILEKVLDNWSIVYGGLQNYPTEHIFLANPIWNKLLIKVKDGIYCWPISNLFLHTSLELMESVFYSNAELKERYEKRRSKFLEEEIETLFKASLPEALIHKNLVWHDQDGNKDYENDLLIIVDSFAVVIEAKAGKISAPSKRGAPDRLKREIEKLLVEPSRQASRFAKFLAANLQMVEMLDVSGEKVIVDLSSVKQVLTWSITFDLFGSIGSRLPDFYYAGLIDSKEDLSPSMSLADLEIVLDLLETSSEKIHYLVRRYQFEKNAIYHADEMDLLVFYLQTGFNIGATEYGEYGLMLYGESQKLDPYYMRKFRAGDKNISKPRPRRTKWWNDILLKLDNKKFPRWTEVGFILLNVSFEDQQKFENRVTALKKTVKRDWIRRSHINTVVLFNGPPQRRDIIIGWAYKNVNKDERKNKMESIVAEAIEEEKIKRVLIIGFDIDAHNHYPYSVLGLLSK
jgi:hypothetical protein